MIFTVPIFSVITMKSAQASTWECVYLLQTIACLSDQFQRTRQEKVYWKTLAKLQVSFKLAVVKGDMHGNCCRSQRCYGDLTEGLQEVILYHQPDDKKKNRGFCFLEYEDHKSAAQARRRLMSGKVKVWGNPVTVEWADPVAEPDPEVMAKVRKLNAVLICSNNRHAPFWRITCFLLFVGQSALCKEAGDSRD